MAGLRDDLYLAAQSVYGILDDPLKEAEIRLSAMRSRIGLRDVNNLYAYDDVHMALAALTTLRAASAALLNAADSILAPGDR